MSPQMMDMMKNMDFNQDKVNQQFSVSHGGQPPRRMHTRAPQGEAWGPGPLRPPPSFPPSLQWPQWHLPGPNLLRRPLACSPPHPKHTKHTKSPTPSPCFPRVVALLTHANRSWA